MAKKVQGRPKLLKDYDKLPKEVITAIKAEYPNGFSHKLIAYTTPKGEKVMALPFDTPEFSYLVRVTVMDTRAMVKVDDEDGEEVKAPREDLDLDGLDIDGLKEEDDSFSDDDGDDTDEEESYRIKTRRRSSEEDDDGDDDY
jgi:DNA-directed RNA polymerase subunit delta